MICPECNKNLKQIGITYEKGMKRYVIYICKYCFDRYIFDNKKQILEKK